MSGIEHRQRLAAILAADAAGYSRLMAGDEHATVAALDAARTVFRELIQKHKGRVVDMAGDSVLAVFETAVGAVTAALAVQNELSKAAADAPDGQQMRFRIGVQLGDVIEKLDGTVYGDGVNIAARLQALAEPGGIAVSDSIHTAVRGKVSAKFEDQGEQEVKNIADPVRVYRVLAVTNGDPPVAREGAAHWIAAHASRRRQLVAAGFTVTAAALAAAAWQWWPSAARGGGVVPITMSLAVGLIAAPAGDATMVQAADLLALNLVSGLGAVEQAVRIVSIDREANAAATIHERARAAGARYVVEGQLQGVLPKRQLTLNLIETGHGTLAWSHRFDVPNVATSVEAQIAMRNIMAELDRAVMDAEIKRVLLKPVNQLDAMEFVVRASAVLMKGESVAIANEGRSLLDEALRLDPTLVEANIATIWALAMINEVDRQPQRERYLREADEFSARAVTLNKDSSRAWLSRAHALLGLGRWNASLEACDRAMKLDPYFWRPYVVRAEFLIGTGRPAEALPVTEKALALSPNLGAALELQCEAHLLMGDDEEAIHSCERASGLLSNEVAPYSFLAAAHANAGDMVHAHSALKVMLKVVPGATIAELRARRYSEHPEYQRLVEKYFYGGLRKAGLPDQ